MPTNRYIAKQHIPTPHAGNPTIEFSEINNRALLYGDGVFETMRVDMGGVWQLEKHLARLKKSTDFFGLENQFESVAQKMKMLHTDSLSLVRVSIIRNASSKNLPFFGNEGGEIWTRRKLPSLKRPKLISIPNYYIPSFELHEYKTINYLRSIQCRRIAIQQGCDDGVMLSENGSVGETSSANIWAVFEDHVVTPSLKGILPGIVRETILEGNLGSLPVEVRPLKIDELLHAKEIALSSVGVGVIAANSFKHRSDQFPDPFPNEFINTLEENWAKGILAELFHA